MNDPIDSRRARCFRKRISIPVKEKEKKASIVPDVDGEIKGRGRRRRRRHGAWLFVLDDEDKTEAKRDSQ